MDFVNESDHIIIIYEMIGAHYALIEFQSRFLI